MSKGKELAKNTLIITIGKISTQFISFFLIPLYTTYLDTADYGTVDLINTYISLFVPIVTLQLEQAIFRFLIDARKDEEQKKVIISNIFRVIIIHSIIFLILGIVLSNFIILDYKYFLIINVIVCMVSSLNLQIARGLGETKVYTYGSMMTGLISVTLNVLLIAVIKMNAEGILISNCIANIICNIYLFKKLKLNNYIKTKSKKNPKMIKSMYKYSLPLIPNSISWWIINVSDRTIISLILGLSYNGIYSISNKFSNIYILIYNLFNLSWTESVSLYINDNNNKNFFEEMTNRMFNLFASICILIIAGLPMVFNWIIKGDYKLAYNYMPILLVASLFNVVVGLYSAVYVAKKETKELAKSSVISAIINIIVNLLLIKHIGLYAAAISTLVAYLVLMIYRYIDVKKYVNIKLNKKNLIILNLLLLVSIMCYYYSNIYLCILNLIIIIIMSIIINKELINSLIEYLKQYILRKKDVKCK